MIRRGEGGGGQRVWTVTIASRERQGECQRGLPPSSSYPPSPYPLLLPPLLYAHRKGEEPLLCREGDRDEQRKTRDKGKGRESDEKVGIEG